MTTIDADRCLVCGAYGTCNGFTCVPCLQARAHTIHYRWFDPRYWDAVQAEHDAKTEQRGKQAA